MNFICIRYHILAITHDFPWWCLCKVKFSNLNANNFDILFLVNSRLWMIPCLKYVRVCYRTKPSSITISAIGNNNRRLCYTWSKTQIRLRKKKWQHMIFNLGQKHLLERMPHVCKTPFSIQIAIGILTIVIKIKLDRVQIKEALHEVF